MIKITQAKKIKRNIIEVDLEAEQTDKNRANTEKTTKLIDLN